MPRLFRQLRAGTLLPALFVVAAARASVPSPSSEPGSNPRLREEATSPMEAAIARAEARLRKAGTASPASEGAVEFALLLYAEGGRAADLRLAASLAERIPEAEGPEALYRVAQAGGPTLAAAEARLPAIQDAVQAPGAGTETAAHWALSLCARATAVKDPAHVQDALMASAAVLDSRVRAEGNRLGVIEADGSAAGFAATLRTLRVLTETAQLSGSPEIRDDAVKVALELVRRFWDEASSSFGTGADAPGPGLQAEGALAIWEAGFLGGNALLSGRAGRVLSGIRERAMADPAASASFALAASRASRHPVQMVLLGVSGDPTLTELRNESYCLFEPRRILLSLDPHVDGGRIEQLGYPPDMAPVLFVCVESICSAPIQAPEGLAKKVKDIVALAAGTQE